MQSRDATEVRVSDKPRRRVGAVRRGVAQAERLGSAKLIAAMEDQPSLRGEEHRERQTGQTRARPDVLVRGELELVPEREAIVDRQVVERLVRLAGKAVVGVGRHRRVAKVAQVGRNPRLHPRQSPWLALHKSARRHAPGKRVARRVAEGRQTRLDRHVGLGRRLMRRQVAEIPGLAVQQKVVAHRPPHLANRLRIDELHQVEAQPIDAIFLREVAGRVGNQLARHPAPRLQRRPGASRPGRHPVLVEPQVAAGRRVLEEPRVVDMVVDDIEHHTDARAVQRQHQLLQLANARVRVRGTRGQPAVRAEVIVRVVAPVVGARRPLPIRQGALALVPRIKGLHRHQLHMGDAERLQVGERFLADKAAKGAAQLRQHPRLRVDGEVAHVHLVADEIDLARQRPKAAIPALAQVGKIVLAESMRVSLARINDGALADGVSAAGRKGGHRLGIGVERPLASAIGRDAILIEAALQRGHADRRRHLRLQSDRPHAAFPAHELKPANLAILFLRRIEAQLDPRGRRRPELERDRAIPRQHRAQIVAVIKKLGVEQMPGNARRHPR